jgi:hypothetical protein
MLSGLIEARCPFMTCDSILDRSLELMLHLAKCEGLRRYLSASSGDFTHRSSAWTPRKDLL